MSVVTHGAWRRWTAVAGGVLALCLLPVALAARPAARVGVEPGQLRERILASARVPYQGYIDTRGSILLPEVPAIREVAQLVRGTRLRSWYSTPDAWRVAILETTGERDITGRRPAPICGTSNAASPLSRWAICRCACRPPPTCCRPTWLGVCSPMSGR